MENIILPCHYPWDMTPTGDEDESVNKDDTEESDVCQLGVGSYQIVINKCWRKACAVFRQRIG